MASRWRDCAKLMRPGEWLIALRRRWHEGTARLTVLTSFRACGLALLPGPHTTHIVRLVVPPTLILFAPTTPRARDPSARN